MFLLKSSQFRIIHAIQIDFNECNISTECFPAFEFNHFMNHNTKYTQVVYCFINHPTKVSLIKYNFIGRAISMSNTAVTQHNKTTRWPSLLFWLQFSSQTIGCVRFVYALCCQRLSCIVGMHNTRLPSGRPALV